MKTKPLTPAQVAKLRIRIRDLPASDDDAARTARLSSLGQRLKTIASIMRQMLADQERWNRTNPDDEPLDELRGMEEHLAGVDAAIAKWEQQS